MPGARITYYEQPDRGEDRDDWTHQQTSSGQPGTVPGATARFRQRPGNGPRRCPEAQDLDVRHSTLRQLSPPRRDAQPLGDIRRPTTLALSSRRPREHALTRKSRGRRGTAHRNRPQPWGDLSWKPPATPTHRYSTRPAPTRRPSHRPRPTRPATRRPRKPGCRAAPVA